MFLNPEGRRLPRVHPSDVRGNRLASLLADGVTLARFCFVQAPRGPADQASSSP